MLVTISEEVPLLSLPTTPLEGGLETSLENETGLQAEFAAWDAAGDEDWQKMEHLLTDK